MSRAAVISTRLWQQGRYDWLRTVEKARKAGMTPVEWIEKRTREWEGHLMDSRAVPQLRQQDETTEIVVDLNLERYLREALRAKMFMRHQDIDDVFAYARELAQREAGR